jgi:hypothetical protein
MKPKPLASHRSSQFDQMMKAHAKQTIGFYSKPQPSNIDAPKNGTMGKKIKNIYKVSAEGEVRVYVCITIC